MPKIDNRHDLGIGFEPADIDDRLFETVVMDRRRRSPEASQSAVRRSKQQVLNCCGHRVSIFGSLDCITSWLCPNNHNMRASSILGFEPLGL